MQDKKSNKHKEIEEKLISMKFKYRKLDDGSGGWYEKIYDIYSVKNIKVQIEIIVEIERKKYWIIFRVLQRKKVQHTVEVDYKLTKQNLLKMIEHDKKLILISQKKR